MSEITVLACTNPACEEKVGRTLEAIGKMTDLKFNEIEKRLLKLEQKEGAE